MTTSRTARDYGFGYDFAPKLPHPISAEEAARLRAGVPTVAAGPGVNWDNTIPPATGPWQGVWDGQWGTGRDAYGNPIRSIQGMYADPAAAPVATPAGVPVGGANIGQYQPPAMPAVATTPAPVTPATPEAFAGSPLNTMYGIDSESNLTEDQKKLARMIQGKFDASLNRRDRELAQYGAPRLASFVEDEALARAMSLARGLNIPVKDALGMVQGSGPASRGGGTGGGGGGSGGTGRAPSSSVTTPRTTTQANPARTAAMTAPPNSTPQQKQDWMKMLQGLTAYIPMLFGKEGMDVFGNKGLYGMLSNAVKTGYNKIFGTDPPPFTYNTVGQMFSGPEYGTVNAITGGIDQTGNGMLGDPTGTGGYGIQGLTPPGVTPSFGPADPFGPYGSYGDMAPPVPGYDYTNPDFVGPEYVPPYEFGGGDGGGYVDPYFDYGGNFDFGGGEYWYPDDLFSSADPFGIGGY